MPPPDAALVSDAQIRSLAREIVARPEYAKYQSFAQTIWRELIEDALRWLAGLPQLRIAAPLLYWTWVVGLSLVALLLIAHIAWTISRAMSSPEPRVRAAHRRTERDFEGAALRLAETGQYLEASHQLLLASLAHAGRSHVLELRPEDGNLRICELLRSSAMAEGLRERLVALIDVTQTAWFGKRKDDEGLYRAWSETYAALQRSGA